MKKIILTFLVFILGFGTYHSQELKNNIEFGLLGNLGFLHIGYTRSVFSFSQLSVNTGLKAGYVPSSGDEESKHPENSVPNFAHINLPVEVLWKFHRSTNIGIGASYSKIFVGSSEYGNHPKTNYNRILGEISYGHILSRSDYEESTTWIRIYFTPIMYDDHADDVSNIPVRLVFVYNF
ncbi:hypothetical protein [Chryseobacterium hagamense]|uniref:Outer membrane protein beta-barrel domain-containing protein n=1 Tax=Chryseobacterium hagamense TaxID=395935 RepID=A0A511YLZ5_9FLAO|nr:hypothetical protein [Chryseobacterium hagamense]GEN76225.1 hypothetical protein CHA01nite_19650 [Chryseobacterium hagamense]